MIKSTPVPYLCPCNNRFRSVRRLATSATLLLKSIRCEEEAAALAGARYSPSRRVRTAAVMELLEGTLDNKEDTGVSAEASDIQFKEGGDEGNYQNVM